jgi:hypothetical protein
MPEAADLPDELKALARRNALKLSHDRFRTESEQLASTVGQVLEKVEARRRELEEKERLETERNETEEKERREAARQQKEEQEQLAREQRQSKETEDINQSREREQREGKKAEVHVNQEEEQPDERRGENEEHERLDAGIDEPSLDKKSSSFSSITSQIQDNDCTRCDGNDHRRITTEFFWAKLW